MSQVMQVHLLMSDLTRIPVEASFFAGGLAVHPDVDGDVIPSAWSISHPASGYSLVKHIDSYHAAVDFCTRLSQCDVDWNALVQRWHIERLPPDTAARLKIIATFEAWRRTWTGTTYHIRRAVGDYESNI